MRTSYVLGSAAGDVVGAGTPTIAAMRRTLEDKFPYLAFAVQTKGLPFYEVILTTDPALFTPAVLTEAAARDQQPEDRFFSSRKASGLIAAENEQYSVPSAVLQRFARASAIYYTVIAFADRAMGGARPAADASTLRQNAPSISIAPGFTGATLGAILAVPLYKLQTVPFETRRDGPDVDAAAGEDGYGRTYAMEEEDDEDPGYGLALESVDEDGGEDVAAQSYAHEDDSYQDGFETSEAYESVPSYEEDDEPHAEAAAFEEEDAADVGAVTRASAFDSTFGPGEAMPGLLQDADHQGVADHEYNDGYSDAMEAVPAPAPIRSFGIAERRFIIETLGRVEGAPNPYAVVRMPPASNPGALAFGHVGFTVESGHLGRLLAMMKARHAAKFAEVFGPDAEALLQATKAPGPGARQAGTHPLHHPSWIARLVESARPDLFGAGQPQLFNGAQNELASELFLDPMLPIARGLDLTTDRALALLVDVASRIGSEGAARWVVLTVGGVQSPAQRQQALSALGFPGIREFQAATPGTESDGVWGPKTHAAVVGKLRALGPRSPLPITSGAENTRALVRQAPPEWAARAQAIARSSAFSDTAHAI